LIVDYILHIILDQFDIDLIVILTCCEITPPITMETPDIAIIINVWRDAAAAYIAAAARTAAATAAAVVAGTAAAIAAAVVVLKFHLNFSSSRSNINIVI